MTEHGQMWDWGLLPWLVIASTSSLGHLQQQRFRPSMRNILGTKRQYYLIINSAENEARLLARSTGKFLMWAGETKSFKTHPPETWFLDHTHSWFSRRVARPGPARLSVWAAVSHTPVLVVVWSFLGGLCSSSAIVSSVLGAQPRLLLGNGWI